MSFNLHSEEYAYEVERKKERKKEMFYYSEW